MLVAAGQFAVTPDWTVNAQTCVSMMRQAGERGATLLVLPEALLARNDADADLSVKSAQQLDGGFTASAGGKRKQSLDDGADPARAFCRRAGNEYAGGVTSRENYCAISETAFV